MSRTTSYFLYDLLFVARRTSRIETCVGEMRDPLGSSIDGRIRRFDRRSSTMSFGGCIGGGIEEIVYYCSRLKLKKGYNKNEAVVYFTLIYYLLLIVIKLRLLKLYYHLKI